MGVLQVLSGVTVAGGLLFAVSYASRCLHRRVPVAGAAVVPPAPQPAGGMAVPVITDAPDREERGAFAYDNGILTGRPDGGDTS